MSDNSDSDDSILQQAVFRKRRQSSTRNNNDSFLEKLVQTRQAETLTGLQVARLERETTEIRPLVKKERVAVEASDETRTSSLSLLSAMLWEPTKTLFANPLYLPNTDPQQTRARLKSMSTRSNITLPNERESWDLITPRIFQKLLLSHNNNKQQLSPRGPDWTNYLLKLTCCTNDKMQGMAIGAAQFLQEVLLVTNLCELKVQLEECWGIRVSEDIASSNENTTTRQARESCHAQNVTVAWARWLQVWDMIFRRGMVNRDHTTTTSTQAVDDVILDCIVLLVRGASDPFLRDERYVNQCRRL